MISNNYSDYFSNGTLTSLYRKKTGMKNKKAYL